MRELEQLVAKCGLRVSAKRRGILQVLERAETALSAREIHAQLLRNRQSISLASVHLFLHALCVSGLLAATPSKGRGARYRVAQLPQAGHLVDVRSGRVRGFRSADMQLLLEETARGLGYELLDYRLELFGIAECAGPTASPGVRRPRELRRPSASCADRARRSATRRGPDSTRA